MKIDAKGRLENCFVLERNTLSEEKLVVDFEAEDKENVAQGVLDRLNRNHLAEKNKFEVDVLRTLYRMIWTG